MRYAWDSRSSRDQIKEITRHEEFLALGLIPIMQMMTRGSTDSCILAPLTSVQLSDAASLISHYRAESLRPPILAYALNHHQLFACFSRIESSRNIRGRRIEMISFKIFHIHISLSAVLSEKCTRET